MDYVRSIYRVNQFNLLNFYMKKKLILFDLYNTLVVIKHKKNAYYPIIDFLIKHDISKKNIRQKLLTEDSAELKHFFSKWNVPLFLIEETNKLLEEELNSIESFSDVKEVLSLLKEDAYLVLISNLASPYRQAVYDLDLADFFDKIIFSCDVGFVKPQKEMFELALNAYPMIDKSNVLMIGDSPIDDKKGALSVEIPYQLINRKGLKEKGIINSLKELI